MTGTIAGQDVTVFFMRRQLDAALSALAGGHRVNFTLNVEPTRDSADDGPEVDIIRRVSHR